MLEVLTTRRVLNRETNLLERRTTVIVRSEDVDARFLQRAEQAPLPCGFVVFAVPIVGTIPARFVLEQHGGTSQDRKSSAVTARSRRSNSGLVDVIPGA